MWAKYLARGCRQGRRSMSSMQTKQSLSQSGTRFHGKADFSFENSVWTLGAISLILPVGVVLLYDPVPADRNDKKKKASMFGDDYPTSLSTTGVALGKESQSPLPSGRAYLIKSGQRQVCVTQYGSDAGKPVLLFHGLAASRVEAAATLSIAEPLPSGEVPDLHALCVASNTRLLCVDRPGYGLTSPADSASDAPATTVSDAVRVLDALRISAARVMAVDMGSVPALLLASKHADRVHGDIHLLAPDYCRSVAPSDGMARSVRDAFLRFAPVSSPFMHLFAKFLRLTTLAMPADSLKNAQMQNMTKHSSDEDMMQRMSGELMLSCAQCSMDSSATGVQHDLTVQLGRHEAALEAIPLVSQHVHLWRGSADQVVADAVPVALEQGLVNSKSHMLQSAGHLSTIAQGLLAVTAEL